MTQKLLDAWFTPFTQEFLDKFTNDRKPQRVAEKVPELVGDINFLMQLSFMGMQDIGPQKATIDLCMSFSRGGNCRIN